MTNPELDAALWRDSTEGTPNSSTAFDGLPANEVLPIRETDLTATDEALAIAEAGPGSELVSHFQPDGLILSTGNLFFTHHDAASASVWRTSQSASPGQEILLYSEPDAQFGDIVFAQVDGVFFGYFFAGPGSAGGPITIKRIPLTGGAATVLVSLQQFGNNVDIVNTHRNLITDGEHLYWQDDRFIRKMPIRGGDVTAIDEARPNTPTAGLALLNENIFYASVEDILIVPTTGANTSPLVRTIARASGHVLTLHAESNGVYWGEHGAVRRKVGSTTRTLAVTSSFPTSISARGFMFAWTDCIGTECRLNVASFFHRFSMPISDLPLGVTITPSRTVFWGDTAGVHRKAF